MKRKIFISINIPKKDKKRLIATVSQWQDLPVKWVKEPNFHLTLAFLGHVYDNALPAISQAVERAVLGKIMFDVQFSEIKLNSEEDPKIIWLAGSASEELKNLQEAIEKELGLFASAKKVFIPHITLGRIRKQKWEELMNKPPASTCGDASSTRGGEIKKALNFIVTVESVDVMASDFENGGEEYAIIDSFPLNG